MTGAQFDRHDLVLVPLTPIHIGGGEEARLLPEDYRLRDGHAERVAVRAILARLPEDERAQWIATMARAQGEAAANVMRDALRRLQGKATTAEVLERIPISPVSARSVDLGGEGAQRRNQIDACFRAGGRPCLPGSSVKGMLRTAWAAAMAARLQPQPKRWKTLEAELFGLSEGKRAQDTDPLRDVTVTDAPLPEGATRIDPVRPWKRPPPDKAAPGAPRPYGFGDLGQLHRERLVSVADGGAPPVIALALGLRAASVRRQAGDLGPDRRPDPERAPASLAELLAALEAQHEPLWRREVEKKFFAGPHGDRLRAALGLFAGLRRDGADPEAALVRLGWAAHAEAKSLAGLRRIEIINPKNRSDRRIAAEGTARHVVDLAGHPLPFGWALLVRAEAWAAKRPAAWLAPPAPRAAPATGGMRAAPAGPRAATALGQQLRYRKGQRVRVDGETAELLEDVTEAAREDDRVGVRLDGDTETIRIREIEGPA